MPLPLLALAGLASAGIGAGKAIYGGIQSRKNRKRAERAQRAEFLQNSKPIAAYGDGGWANTYGMPAIAAGPQAPTVPGLPNDPLSTPTAMPGMPAYQYQDVKVDPKLTGLARQAAIQSAIAGQERQAGLQRQIAMRNMMDSEYLRRIQEAQGQLQGLGNAQREELSRGTVRDTAAAAQQAQRQGWGSSSVAANLGRGVRADAAFNRNRLEEAILGRKMQTGQDLTAQRLAFLNSIQDEVPTSSDVRNLLLQGYGAKESKDALAAQLEQMKAAQKKSFLATLLGAGIEAGGSVLASKVGASKVGGGMDTAGYARV